MSLLLQFSCDSCDFELKTWENGLIYVINDNKERIECSHPGEWYKVAKVLKIEEDELFGFPYMRIPNLDLYPLLNKRVGVLSDCMCQDCATVNKLDYQMDERKCLECGRSKIIPIDNLEGRKCPNVKQVSLSTNRLEY